MEQVIAVEETLTISTVQAILSMATLTALVELVTKLMETQIRFKDPIIWL